MEIGARISKLRSAKGITQSELAEKLSVSRELVNLWENGLRQIKGKDIVRLADALETTCDYLLRGYIQADVGQQILAAVCGYTGLTEKSVEAILNMNKTALNGLNAVLENMNK